jgi:hypothetical protein
MNEKCNCHSTDQYVNNAHSDVTDFPVDLYTNLRSIEHNLYNVRDRIGKLDYELTGPKPCDVCKADIESNPSLMEIVRKISRLSTQIQVSLKDVEVAVGTNEDRKGKLCV